MTLQQATIDALIATGWTANEAAAAAVTSTHGVRDGGQVVMEVTLKKAGRVDDYTEWKRANRRYVAFSQVTLSEGDDTATLDANLYVIIDGTAEMSVEELFSAGGIGARTIGNTESGAAFMEITGTVAAR